MPRPLVLKASMPPPIPMGCKVSPPFSSTRDTSRARQGEKQGDKPIGEKRGDTPNLSVGEIQVEKLKQPSGEKQCDTPKPPAVGEKHLEKPKQPGGEIQADKPKQPSGENNGNTQKQPAGEKQGGKPKRFVYAMMKRSPPPVPNSSPPPTTPMGSKVSPPKQPSGENQGDKPGGEKQIERKLSQFSEDKRGEKTNQTASEKQVEAPKPPGGEKKCEKPKLSSVEKQVEKPKQPGGEKQGDKAKQLPAFTDPANKITAEQRAVRARGSATPKREQQGAKDTYGSLLMSRAKGRIADELLIQYDVYLEKYRDFYCEDPSIPRCVRRPVRAAWDFLSPHVRNEYVAIIEQEIGLRQKRRETLDQETGWLNKHASNLQKWPTLLRSCWVLGDKIRNAILYAYYPYDKTTWKIVQSPLWWILFCFRAFPALGINSMSFAATLLLIDRQDHFQLVQFILDFKKYQFLINGMLMLCYFSAHYSYCVIRNENRDCGERGPGNYSIGPGLGPNVLFLPTFIGFVLQIMLVWIALHRLQFSISKGGTVRKGERLLGDTVQWKEDHPDPKKKAQVSRTGAVIAYDRKTGLHTVELISGVGRKRGGHFITTTVQVPLHQIKYYVAGEKSPLRHLLYYDLACFVIVCALALAFLRDSHQDGTLKRFWQYRSTFVAAQIGYSLCTVPFLFASLPPFSTVVTHARETGYTKNGVCVTLMEFQQHEWVVRRALHRDLQKRTAKKLPPKRFRNVTPSLEGKRGWFKGPQPQSLPKAAIDSRSQTPASNAGKGRGRSSRPRYVSSLDSIPTAAEDETPLRGDRVNRVISEMGEAVLPPPEEASGTVVAAHAKGDELKEAHDFVEAEEPAEPLRSGFGIRFDDMIVRMPKNAKPGDIVEFEVKRTGHKARITLPAESKLGAKIKVKVPHPPSFYEPPGGLQNTELETLEPLWDEMVVRLPRKARPGDIVEFEITKTGQHARITVPEGAKPRQAVQVKVPKLRRPPPRLGPEPPSVGNVYRIKLISGNHGSRPGAYLDAHRSFRRDERSMDSTFVLAHDLPISEEVPLQKTKMAAQWKFLTRAPLQSGEGLMGSWLLEALSARDLEAAQAVQRAPGGVRPQAYFRMKCLTGHFGCPDGGYLCGVASDASIPLKGATEAKILRRDDNSTWAFIQPLRSQDTTLGLCTSYIWALEPSDEHTGADGRWKLRLITSVQDSPEQGNYYLEVHRDLVKGAFKDARSHLSTYVHVHKETYGVADFSGDWIFEVVHGSELV